mmetsp:Transcript_31692/g.57748  ORF Transcript_31692/g.57748 Transcript_31692/m.57748 type:complete len:355 (+) Transcript_31692:94-1158(+)
MKSPLVLASLIALLASSVRASTPELKILFFWAVDGQERTIQLVRQNVEDAVARGGADCCDFMLAHHNGTVEDWNRSLPRGWYEKYIGEKSLTRYAWKYHLLQDAYTMNLGGGRWEQRYEYIWALDSDIRLVGMNYLEFFKLVRASGSPLVSPAFSGKAGMNLAEQTSKRVGHQGDISLDSAPATGHLVRKDNRHQHRHHHLLNQKTSLNPLGNQRGDCKLRHTDFVEMTAPMLSRQVFAFFLQRLQCPDCMPNPKGEWGLDSVWCNLVEKAFLIEDNRSCAYIDATPVQHLDWRTTHADKEFEASAKAVSEKLRPLLANQANFDCVKEVPMKAEVLVLSARGPQQSAHLESGHG